MTLDFLFLTIQPGLLVIDVVAWSSAIQTLIGAWLVVFLIRFVSSILKMIPFL